jgi:hypothetical protein
MLDQLVKLPEFVNEKLSQETQLTHQLQTSYEGQKILFEDLAHSHLEF